MRAPAITETMRGTGLAEYETRYINVQDPPFGARGDGVTDETTNIQTAIDTVAILGGTVYVPPGIFLITNSLRVPGNVKLEGAALGTASTIMLSGNIVGIDIDDMAIGVIIKNICVTNSVREGTGIYIHGNSRKIVISGCHLYNLANGIMASGAWTINIQDMCWIYRNIRGVNIYRRTDEGETTTIDIVGNSIYDNDTYNISVGEYSQANGESGVQCATLNIQNNMMGVGQNYIAGVKSLTFENNHGESFGDKWVEFGYYVYNASLKNNLCTNGNYAFYFEGGSHRNITIENNDFSGLNQYAIWVKDVLVGPIRIKNNKYYLVGGKVCYPFNTGTKRIAETIFMEGDDYDSIINGHIVERANAAPVTGRYKIGSIVFNSVPAPGEPEGWIFIASEWGMDQSVWDTDDVDADEPTNIVTPTDLEKFKQGDRLLIPGAGAAGADLTTVIASIDYVAGTFAVWPAIETTVLVADCTLLEGKWRPLGAIESADAYTPTNVTPDRSFDADTVLIAELADIVGTLIADFQSAGILR